MYVRAQRNITLYINVTVTKYFNTLHYCSTTCQKQRIGCLAQPINCMRSLQHCSLEWEEALAEQQVVVLHAADCMSCGSSYSQHTSMDLAFTMYVYVPLELHITLYTNCWITYEDGCDVCMPCDDYYVCIYRTYGSKRHFLFLHASSSIVSNCL